MQRKNEVLIYVIIVRNHICNGTSDVKGRKGLDLSAFQMRRCRIQQQV